MSKRKCPFANDLCEMNSSVAIAEKPKSLIANRGVMETPWQFPSRVTIAVEIAESPWSWGRAMQPLSTSSPARARASFKRPCRCSLPR